jgi:competence protein ComEC
VGFQLSFAATLGLILLVSPLQEVLENWLHQWLSEASVRQALNVLNDALVVTLAAQITTTPVILYTFGRLSLVSLLTNFLVLPAQPGVMVWGGIATLLGLVWLPMGQMVSWVAWLFLTYTVRVVEITSRIPFAAIDIQRPSLIVIWLYYGVLLGWLAWKGGWSKSIGVVQLKKSS